MVAFDLKHVHERRYRGCQPHRRHAAVVQQQNRAGPQPSPQPRYNPFRFVRASARKSKPRAV